jgi:uncharacterized BrkB/YihY/UPF0761 family membrane protein
MQFQVPQFIDTEDKIVGPLSLRQFGFIAAGGILSAILYFSVEPWLWVIGSIIIFGAAIALAFVKIEGRPFASVLVPRSTSIGGHRHTSGKRRSR